MLPIWDLRFLILTSFINLSTTLNFKICSCADLSFESTTLKERFKELSTSVSRPKNLFFYYKKFRG